GCLAGGALMDLLQRAGIGRSAWSRVPARLVSLPGAAYAAALAHLGLAVTVIGITASSAWQTEVITTMTYGETRDVAGYDITLADVGPVRGPNFVANEATFEVSRDGEHVATLTSERRRYLVEGSTTTEVGIESNLWRDVYVVIGEETGDGLHVARLYHNPLVLWIWLGTLLMGVAAVVSMADRRYRVGAPEPKAPRAAAPVPSPQAGS
ncbi:MAG: cytochrome c-type biogenesis CcmF C-terminal domain-containing protein, partial [Pseudomonadota bacterium]